MNQSGNHDDDDDEQPTREGGVPVYVVNRKTRPAALRLVKGPGAPSNIALAMHEFIVGRSNDAHFTVDSDAVSRKHAAFRQTEAGTHLEDLDSANGVYVNGTKVQSATLHDGDSIQIGEALFIYDAAR